MGYYSDVALAMTDSGMTILHEKLETIPLALTKEVEGLFRYADKHFIDKDTNAEVWVWSDIKWYENDPLYFPEIHFVTGFLDSLEGEDYRFIRIGEDYDDTETRGEFTENPFDLELARGISINQAYA